MRVRKMREKCEKNVRKTREKTREKREPIGTAKTPIAPSF
jgi:hypothetical protein